MVSDPGRATQDRKWKGMEMDRPNDPRAGYIAIASRVFAVHGFHGASLARLAQEAGVTKQALLHFYGTKAKLYAEVLSQLADRQIQNLERAARPEAVDHLQTYFVQLIDTAFSEPGDVRLVVRALLDSTDAARTWPLKPYVDALVELFGATPAGQGKSIDALRTQAFQVIGSIHFVSIAAPAITGMYGKASVLRSKTQLQASITETVHGLARAD
ncbi:MAG: TetR/AcrR family transcriptional regulator [Pseudomonadota bacterium]